LQTANLIVDGPADGAWNMAVDEALLRSANETGVTTLRFYQWAEPTLSLGYFQKAADRKLHPASSGCTMVRRSSGGGAILHDCELTYSLALPGTNRWSSKQNDLYGTVHESIVNFLHRNGVFAGQFEVPVNSGPGEVVNVRKSGHITRFLCFERRTAGDIVLDGHKIGGSAQRRLSGATLQHGSLLMQRSQFAPELAGILDLTDVNLSVGDLASGLVEAMAGGLKLTFQSVSLTKDEKKIAEEILIDKYENPEWNGKK